MSETPVETPPADESSILLRPQGDVAFDQLMDFLAPEGDGAPVASGDAAAATDAGAAGQAAPPAEGTGAKASDAGTPPAGDAGKPAVPNAGDPPPAAAEAAKPTEPPAGDRPAEWTATPEELTTQLGEISTKFEDAAARAYHEEALAGVREEHSQYFEALERHPRLLVGQEVPSLTGDGMERLKDAEDAREWQDAVKSLLAEEVRDRASRALEDNSDFLGTVHNSIKLFQDNADLVPGGKSFDVELANRFAALAKPYEVRVDGKLHGYSIPVQPIINQLRTDLAASRAASTTPPAAAAPAPTGGTTPPAAAPKEEEPPQAGLQSKAGASSETDDFSTLFGTLGEPYRNLRI